MTRRFFAYLPLLAAVFALFPQVGQGQFPGSRSALVIQSYQLAFCRMPSNSERRGWVQSSDRRADSLPSLLRAHRDWLRNQSSEKYQVTVRAFQQALGRMPNPGELSYWNNQLSLGQVTCDDMVSTLGRERDRGRDNDVGRDWDRDRDQGRDRDWDRGRDDGPNGGPKGAMVTRSYQVAFCRQPSDGEYMTWMRETDYRVANLESLLSAHRRWLQGQGNEKRQATIRAFQQALGRMPSPSEFSYWDRQFSQGNTNCDDVVNTLLRSGRRPIRR